MKGVASTPCRGASGICLPCRRTQTLQADAIRNTGRSKRANAACAAFADAVPLHAAKRNQHTATRADVAELASHAGFLLSHQGLGVGSAGQRHPHLDRPELSGIADGIKVWAVKPTSGSRCHHRSHIGLLDGLMLSAKRPLNRCPRHSAQRLSCASAIRLRPASVLGPLEWPPCSLHLPLRSAFART